MDSEHRHELEENALANWLDEKIETLKPQLPAIVAALVVAVGGVVGWSVYRQSTDDALGAQWRAFTLAMEGRSPSLDMLKQAAVDHPNTGVEEWAEITWADGRLYAAAQLYFRQRSQSDEALAEAKGAYESLLSASNPEVADRAAYGLARALEMQGDLEAAREQYGRVAGPFATLAAERAEELTSSRVASDYEWIASAGEDVATPEATRPDAEPDDIAMPADPLADESEDDEDLDSVFDQFAPVDDSEGAESADAPAGEEPPEATEAITDE